MAQDFIKLTQYAKMFAGLTPEYETLLQEVGPQITPHLKEITEDFYRHLLSIPEAQAYLEGRVESLKATHTRWLEGLFSGSLDANGRKLSGRFITGWLLICLVMISPTAQKY